MAQIPLYSPTGAYPQSTGFPPQPPFQPVSPPNTPYNPGYNGLPVPNQQNPMPSPGGVPEFFSPMATQVAGNMFLNMSSPMLSQTQQAGERWFSSLKYYFTVDNMYVWNKLKILLFPFHKNWNRQMNGNATEYLPPNQDKNAPDLYIPVMAFVTYVILIAFFKGTNNEFTPDVIGMTTTTAFLMLGIEMLLVKAGIWLLNFPNVALLDVLSYVGYKFVAAVINIATGLMLGYYPFLLTYVLTSLTFSVFLARTIQAAISVQPGMGGAGYSTGKTQSYFLIAITVLQFALIYFFCYMSFNSPFVKFDDVIAPTGRNSGTVEKNNVVDTALEFGEIQPSLLG